MNHGRTDGCAFFGAISRQERHLIRPPLWLGLLPGALLPSALQALLAVADSFKRGDHDVTLLQVPCFGWEEG